MILAALVGIAFLVYGAKAVLADRAYDGRAEATVRELVETDTVPISREDGTLLPSYLVYVGFSVGERSVVAPLPGSYAAVWSVGDRVRIAYKSSDPSVIRKDETPLAPILLFSGGGVALLLDGYMLLRDHFDRNKKSETEGL